MNIRPIKNHVLFTFEDKVNSKGQFERERTESGIYLTATVDNSAKVPRWANVVAVGPECTYVEPGQRILLPALRWTTAVKFNGESIWRTDENQVVLTIVTHKVVNILNNYVLFTRPKPTLKTVSGLIIVGMIDNIATGTVFSINSECEPELINSEIYFSTDNFFDNYEYNGAKYSFIKEENILFYMAEE